MSATIGDFYQRVSRAIKRSTLFDDDISGYAADAVRELENNYNWKYMWTEKNDGLLSISATVNQLDISIGDSSFVGIKDVRYLQLKSDAGNLIPVRKTQREKVISIVSGRPGAFWMITKDLIGLDAFPDKAYPYQIGYFAYSERPLIDSCAWLTIAEDLLIARTIRKMQPLLRDDKLIARWSETENSVFPALLEAEVVSEHDAEDTQMVPFTLEVEEDAAEAAIFS